MATVVNLPYISQQVFDDNGKPLSSGKLKFFRNNTDVPSSVYTSDGSTALGYEITLDSAGFPETQYALVQDREYTVKAFDSDGVLIWTRNDIVGCGTTGSGQSGDYVPMTGTSIGDPIVGSLVLQDNPGAVLDTRNTVSKTGVVLEDEHSGSATLSRNGLLVDLGNSAEYTYGHSKISNTNNGFPGYPDFCELTIGKLELHKEVDDSGSRKEKSVKIDLDYSPSRNVIQSKGAQLYAEIDSSMLILATGVVNINGNASGTSPSIELNPTNNGSVAIGNSGSLVTSRLGIGTPLNNKEVSDIWTSASTGTPTDSQLITAKAALAGGGGGSTGACVENVHLSNTKKIAIYGSGIYPIVSSVVASAGGTFSKIGVGLPTGQTSCVIGLGIYDKNGNLVARTPVTTLTWQYTSPVFWIDAESSFTLTAGETYLFVLAADPTYSSTLNYYGCEAANDGDYTITGIGAPMYPFTGMAANIFVSGFTTSYPYMAVK